MVGFVVVVSVGGRCLFLLSMFLETIEDFFLSLLLLLETRYGCLYCRCHLRRLVPDCIAFDTRED